MGASGLQPDDGDLLPPPENIKKPAFHPFRKHELDTRRCHSGSKYPLSSGQTGARASCPPSNTHAGNMPVLAYLLSPQTHDFIVSDPLRRRSLSE